MTATLVLSAVIASSIFGSSCPMKETMVAPLDDEHMHMSSAGPLCSASKEEHRASSNTCETGHCIGMKADAPDAAMMTQEYVVPILVPSPVTIDTIEVAALPLEIPETFWPPGDRLLTVVLRQ